MREQLGSYTIAGRLGAGSMGEVWRARDRNLGREVALKLLPESFADDPERHARFEREAKVLASFNHANIATLYGLEHLDGEHVLVMELVDGEGLDERIARGPITAAEALPLITQIAEALEAAHEKGIVHRDLKPANVRVRLDGTVKVLDFGLAKAWEEEPDEGSLSMSPTITTNRTQPGMILGTAAYMSPEQARGRRVDRRTDIWALGTVVWEMLTGRALFRGETLSDVVAAVILGEPDWEAGARELGGEVVEVLRGCLEKEPRRRFSSAVDVALLLQRAVGRDGHPRTATPVATGGRRRLALAGMVAAAALVTGAALAWLLASGSRPAGSVKLSVVDPDVVAAGGVAISPDGRRLAFVIARETGNLLAIRDLGELDAIALPGTEGAISPFFSPDGRWLGYLTRTELRKVAVTGGSHRTIARLAGRVRFDPWSTGSYPTAAWGKDGTIVFSSGFWREPSTLTGLFTVPGTGGEPSPLTTLDGTELGHRWPRFTPDGGHVVFTTMGRGPRNSHVEVIDLASGRRHRLLSGAANGQVLPSGLLISLDSFYSRLVAAPIDLRRLAPAGPATPLVEGVGTAAANNYAVSASGTLVYLAAGRGGGEKRLVRLSLDGTVATLVDRLASWYQPRTSPDGRHLVVREIGDECRLWLLDLRRKTLTLLTRGGDNHQPVWDPGGRSVAFGREDLSAGVRGLFRQAVDGSSEPEGLLAEDAGDGGPRSLSVPYPDSFSPDGRELLFEQSSLSTGSDLWLMPAAGGRSRKFLATPAFEGDGAFSPDGRWIAYVSDASGREEVYVRAHGGEGGRVQISVIGGEWPIWSHDGTRLYFSRFRRLMAVDFDGTGSEPVVGRPREVLRGFDFGRGNLDLLPDGRSFVLVQPATPDVVELRVVTDWARELRDALP